MKILKDYEKIFQTVWMGLRSYMDVIHKKTIVIGISGGIDSAIIAAIANQIGLNVIGRVLPMDSKIEEVDRAISIGASFCNDFGSINMTDTFNDYINKNIYLGNPPETFSLSEKIRRGNVKARLRMPILYDLAHRNDGIVISTDNLSEWNLGFWTLHGDVGDFGPIQDFWKTEVYGITDFLISNLEVWDSLKADALRDAREAVPTDGLGITNSDFEQLGVDSYEEVDRILIDYMNGIFVNEAHPVIRRHLSSEFKRKIPIHIPRDTI